MAISHDPANASLAHGFHAVAPGDLAAVVTALEMREPPEYVRRLQPEPDVPLQMVRWTDCEAERYRLLYRRIGAPWLWWSRLALEDAALEAIIHDPAVELYAVIDRARVEIGMLELDFRTEGACEIAFFGFVPKATGNGFGKWLMRRALQRAWRDGIERVWVHTCTLDDPRAVAFYRAQGFEPKARFVEVFRDPRAAGLLPADMGALHPLIVD
ncbi:GCN5-related N-acetyltransferase [Novosphingobium nitrogenifigens DSM 19370]|uniref:GCN5-related N-acetyltransferase n=1 Tax=Novosphingobium nitrogenifigens DSM 19370 TaxID=983920 RepID=F1Z8C1_9SPHN|nr:GNAT family N-acetyltransferase [Novosphingobium nitrogenifigens]EGD59104.1 GCN5-related N-acetyltransferase [Novosphingobium nitrogenifigens DSM 19370]